MSGPACGGRTTLAQFGQTPATPSNVTFLPQLGQTTVGMQTSCERAPTTDRARQFLLRFAGSSGTGLAAGAIA